MSDETKVIYHIDDEDTPYLVKLPVGPDKVTLADFKNVLKMTKYMKVLQNITKNDLITSSSSNPWMMILVL
jgi:hypothetical protein